jgi:hypothetical protein
MYFIVCHLLCYQTKYVYIICIQDALYSMRFKRNELTALRREFLIFLIFSCQHTKIVEKSTKSSLHALTLEPVLVVDFPLLRIYGERCELIIYLWLQGSSNNNVKLLRTIRHTRPGPLSSTFCAWSRRSLALSLE